MEIKIDQHNITSQNLLRQVESLCVQEEPPFCAAACPLSIDVRGFCALIKEGKLEDAYSLLMKVSPFMRIIAYTCPEHCKRNCKRNELGGAIELNMLERAVIEACDKESKAPLMLPKKAARIGIAGGGLRGMSAAFNLAKKGYKVTIFEKTDRLGGKIQKMADIIPEQALARDIGALLKYPVEVRFNSVTEFADTESISAFAAEHSFDAMYISAGMPDSASLGGYSIIDMPLSAVGYRKVKESSTVDDVFAGKEAFITLDRLIQGVSYDAGREKEGIIESNLYTNTDGIAKAPAIASVSQVYSREEAALEASRCIQCECMECVKQCPFMQKYKAYPKKYVREVYNNLSITMGTHHANKMINTCAMCSQCSAVCPNGLDMSDMFLAARQHMTSSGKMPASAFEFALLDMEYSMSEDYFLARPAKGQSSCEYLFFPGCQLGASEPELVTRIYRELDGRLGGDTGILLGCCGIMALWAGDNARFNESVKQISDAYNALGKPKVVTGCLNCAQTLREHCGIDAIGVWEVLADEAPDRKHQKKGKSLNLKHACGGRYDTEIFAKVKIFTESLGYELEESISAELSNCCGYGGLLSFADKELSNEFAQKGVEQSGEQPVLTYCINCRDMLLRNGVESYYLLELLYPDGEGLNRRYPTWSERQDNRRILKRNILKEFWGEDMPDGEKLKLSYSDDIREKLEDEHILLSDISAAIEAAETSCNKFKTGRGSYLTSYRPKNVTFWVEYTPNDGKYEILNAYTHRMSFRLTNTEA